MMTEAEFRSAHVQITEHFRRGYEAANAIATQPMGSSVERHKEVIVRELREIRAAMHKISQSR